MAIATASKLGLRLLQELPCGFLAPVTISTNLQFVRHRRIKHWDPKFKLLRKQKIIKIKLPNFREDVEELSEEEIRSKLKERGLLPPRPWSERQFFISCTGGVFEPYVPPEGDGKVSSITAQGAKQKLEFLEKKTKSMMAIRKVRSFEEEFDAPKFCQQAEQTYIKAHQCLTTRNLDEIQQYVTERAYPEITNNIQNKTIHWKFLKAVELPRIVHARCTDVITKENVFGQLTVRFHTQQVLAVYDRFGRLMHGSEIIAKDVLEYVVFEKHLANEYGTWRIHGKIIPDWLPPREPAPGTYKRLPVSETSETSVVETTDQKSADTLQKVNPETLPA